jgi:hypothetical protein
MRWFKRKPKTTPPAELHRYGNKTCPECVELDLARDEATARIAEIRNRLMTNDDAWARYQRSKMSPVAHGYVFKRDGKWVQNVYINGILVFYDEVVEGHRSWQTILDACHSDLKVADRCTSAGHVLSPAGSYAVHKHH